MKNKILKNCTCITSIFRDEHSNIYAEDEKHLKLIDLNLDDLNIAILKNRKYAFGWK